MVQFIHHLQKEGNIMNKKLQVFVSSTYTDLIEERQAAVEAILDAGHIPAGMELFKAGKSQLETIYKWIDNSDVYMLILGGRYGSIEEDSGLSYTELEYQYALSKNMPVFAIVLDDSFLHIKASNAKNIFEKKSKAKFKKFKKFVETKIIFFVNNIDQISSHIKSQLNDIMNDTEYNLIGWTKNISNKFLYSINTNHEQSFAKMITDAKKVIITGRNIHNIISSHGNVLEESIKSGCEYKILLFNYNSEARRILYEKFKYKNYGKKTYKNFYATIDELNRLQKLYPNFQYKLIDRWTDYSMVSIEYNKIENSYIQILLYTETIQGNERPMFKILYGDEWYYKFSQELNILMDI
jgi:hypothetical protein